MITLNGTGASGGLGKGKLYFFHRKNPVITKAKAADVTAERERLKSAQKNTVIQLHQLAEICRRKADMETAAVFEIHAVLAEDSCFTEAVENLFSTESCSAEYAVDQAGKQIASLFEGMGDEYMRARAADIHDVTARILMNLSGENKEIQENEKKQFFPEEPVIIAAEDLSPSETLQMDKKLVLGFITAKGSQNSHTAILARSMGIPAVCGVGEQLRSEYHGQFCCLNGETGEVFVNPNEELLESLEQSLGEKQKQKEKLSVLKGKEDITPDGHIIHVCCNIGSPDEVDAVLANDGHGIGLFRSEFLYLSSDQLPSEEKQFEAYRTVISSMKGKRVVIRTLDIGADKQASYLEMEKEDNPALGMRAIRICLSRPDIFRTQLRAIYRASAFGKGAILFPMITSVWEVKKCLQICEEVKEELRKEEIPFDPHMETGIMIETPAAVFMASELAELVDFFSVGTNDLTQYLLACDRQNACLNEFADPHHPAVLRAIQYTVRAAHAAGIRIGICGELASDLTMLPAFLDMKMDELSVTPSAVLPLREAIRRTRTDSSAFSSDKERI